MNKNKLVGVGLGVGVFLLREMLWSWRWSRYAGGRQNGESELVEHERTGKYSHRRLFNYALMTCERA
jgi:hypothetical protein